MIPGISNTAELIRKTATPALFAKTVSMGKWRMASHLMALDRALTGIATGSIKRLLVEMPPRHGKSQLVSKYFPPWYLGTFPDRDVILTSATDDLALDFSMAGRDVMAEFGPEVFGVSLRKDVQARHRWQLESGGGMRAAGVGGAIMGRGANLLIVDDYFKNVEEALSETQRKKLHQWFMSTSTTRLTPDGAIVIVATRWHPKDLIGQILEEAEHGGEKYTRIRFPAMGDDGAALWPQQFDRTWLEQRKSAYIASGYEWMWEALYQQNPPEVLDAEFSPDYFKDIWFDEWPPLDDIVWRVIALDPSLGGSDKADYSAFVMLAQHMNGTLYVDADLERRDASRIVQAAVENVSWFHPHTFGAEANGFQILLASGAEEAFKRAQWVLPVQAIHNHDNKRSRIRAGLTELLAKGRFRFKRGSPGASLLVEQLKGFPTCKFDDGPDCLEMAVRLVQHAGYGGLAEQDEQPTRVYA